MTTHVTIGDFARITHLSVKTLRHYHRVGLLEPSQVNPATGYRYYGVDQVPAAHTIKRFRELGMPVDEVREVLRAPDTVTRDALVAAHLDRMQAQLAQTQAAVASLRELLTGPGPRIVVERRAVAAAPAIAVRRSVGRGELGAWWTASLAELADVVATRGLARTGPTGGLFEDTLFTEERGTATLFVPVAGAAPAVGAVRPFTVPAADLAVTVHSGSHLGADRTYGALGSYVAEHGWGVPGTVREYYLVDAADTTDVGRWRTEICWEI